MTAEGLREKARELAEKIQEETFMVGCWEIVGDPAKWPDEAAVFIREAMTLALEEAERATGRDPKRCPECELSLQNGSCPMCGWKTARAAIASLRSELGSGPEGE